MTASQAGQDAPIIPMPELSLTELRRAIATVAAPRLPEFFEDMQRAFMAAGEEDSVVPIRMFYRRWGVVVEIERRPDVARRLHSAERDMESPDAEVRARAIQEIGDIAREAHREVARD